MCRQTKNRPSDWISSLHTVPNDKLESGTCSAMKNPGQELRLHPTRSKSSGRLNSSSGCQAAAPSTLSMSPSNCRVDPFHRPSTIHCPRSGRIYLLLYPFHHHSPCKETHRSIVFFLMHWQTSVRVRTRVTDMSVRTRAAGVLRAIARAYRRRRLHMRHAHRWAIHAWSGPAAG